MSTPNLTSLIAVLGSQWVLTDEESKRQTLESWSVEKIKLRQQGHVEPLPLVVLFPEFAEELTHIVHWARTNGFRIRVIGGNTYGIKVTQTREDPSPYVAVDLKRMNRIHWDEESLLVTAEAGCRLGELETQLNQHQYTLGQFPQSLNLITVGGALSTNATGVLSGRYGRIADAVYSLTILLYSGETITLETRLGNGGFGLPDVFLGTTGEFGIITQATLAMFPVPEVRAFAVFSFGDLTTALDAARLVYRSDARPAALCVLDSTASEEFYPSPALLIMVFEGDELVQTGNYQLAFAVCQATGGIPQSAEIGDFWWERRFDTQWFAHNARPDTIVTPFSAIAKWSTIKSVEAAMRGILAPACSGISLRVREVSTHGATLEWRIVFALGEQQTLSDFYGVLNATILACEEAGGKVMLPFALDSMFESSASDRGLFQKWKSVLRSE